MKSAIYRLFLVVTMCAPGALAAPAQTDLDRAALVYRQSPQSQSGANVEEEIARIDDERRNAYLQNDAGTLDRILADDMTAISGIGSADDKAGILADVKSHDLTYKNLTYDHRKIRIYGDTAVVTSHAEIVANYKRRDLTGKLLVTRVYAKQQGSWKLVAIQSTRIPEQVSVAAQDAPYRASAEDTSKVVFVPAKTLDSGIHKAPESGPGVSFIDLIEYTSKGGASVTRRTRPGRADVHKRLADMWYVIEGGGTLVTGGSLLEPTQTEADELRGRGVTGGEERQIGKGDFVKIPAGVPHWVRKIDGKELIYLVVKVASPESPFAQPGAADTSKSSLEHNNALVGQSTNSTAQASAISHLQDEAELRAAMAELHKAALEGTTGKTASLMTDEYVQTDISGHFQEKTEWLNTYSKPLAELIKAGKFHWETRRTFRSVFIAMLRL